jgi:hypothetical protein
MSNKRQAAVAIPIGILVIIVIFAALMIGLGNSEAALRELDRMLPDGKIQTESGIWQVQKNSNGLKDVQTDISHAEERHGVEIATRTRKCLDEKGADLVMTNSKTNRWAEICEVEPGRFGVRIAEQIEGTFQEITIFEFKGNLWDCEYYLGGQQYMAP